MSFKDRNLLFTLASISPFLVNYSMRISSETIPPGKNECPSADGQDVESEVVQL